MFPAAFLPIGQVPATANRLERAAGELRQRAGSPCAVPSLPVTLAHVENALDQLAVSTRLMAEAAVQWSAQDGERADEDRLAAETRALAWHLRRVADALTESRDACPAAGEWARRLLAQTHQGAPMIMQRDRPSAHANGNGSPMRRIVCGVDGSSQARHAATVAHELAQRLQARLMLVHVAPPPSMVPVHSLPFGVDQTSFQRSAELGFSEAEEAFNSLPRELVAADVDREVRLGQPAVVLAEVAAASAAEMIVVGSRGRGPWRSAALGSVSAEVTRLAPCPVMIVPEPAATVERTAAAVA